MKENGERDKKKKKKKKKSTPFLTKPKQSKKGNSRTHCPSISLYCSPCAHTGAASEGGTTAEK